MKKRAAGLLLALLLAGCAPSDKPTAPEEVEPKTETLLGVELTDSLSDRDQGWIEDLDWLGRKWEQYHPDPYFHCSKEEFQWKLERLKAQVGELSDDDLFFEIGSIVIGMDEGRHTKAISPELLRGRVFPVMVQFLGDKAYLTGCAEGYEQFAPYLLHEVVAVNGVDLAYLQRKFESYCSPNNSWYSKETFCEYSMLPAFYDWAGCDYREGYTFRLLDENREAIDVEVPALSWEECDIFGEGVVWVRPEHWDRLAFAIGGNWAEYTESETGGYLYLSFSDLSRAMELAAEAGELASAHPDCRKLIIDLRRNPGGDAGLLEYFSEHMEALKGIEEAYVITGGSSASAAILCASYFKGELNAVVVGEPTGQFTSFYSLRGSSPQILLPFSQIRIFVGDKWSGWEDKTGLLHELGTFAPFAGEYRDEDGRLYDWECMILPDVYVSQDIEDIRQGRDTVIEWVLAQ